LEFSSFITRKRVRGHATLLALVLWLTYAVDLTHPGLRDWFGHLKGADFIHFYVLGTVAREHNARLLYDFNGQVELSRRLVPQSAGDYYLPIYGPQVSLLFVPFAALPYLWAVGLWMLASSAIYAACCYLIWKCCPNLKGESSTVLMLGLAFPGFFNLIAFGQNSAIALAAFTLAYLALKTNRQLFAGLALGLLAYKPQFGLVAACVFLFTVQWKVILGGLITTVGQLGVAWAYYGRPALLDYWHGLLDLNRRAAVLEPKLYQMHSLRSFWKMLLPWSQAAFFAYLASCLVVVALALRGWRSRASLPLGFAAFLFATVLVSPHISVYDLVILAPAFLLIGDWLAGNGYVPSRGTVKLLLYLSYALPLFGPALRYTHLQLSVPVFFAVLALLTNALVDRGSRRTELAYS